MEEKPFVPPPRRWWKLSRHHHLTIAVLFLLTLVVTFASIFFGIKAIRGAAIIPWTQTDWQDGGDGGVIATSASNQNDWTQYFSIINLSATSSPGDLKLATAGFSATDDGTFSSTGFAIGGGFGNGMTSSTAVVGGDVSASVELVSTTTSVNSFEASVPPVPGTLGVGTTMIRNGADDSVYILQGNNTTSFYKYSFSSNSWTTLTAVPGAVRDGATMIRNGADDSIYISRSNLSGDFYKYSISGNSWTTLTAMPNSIATMIRNGADDDIYVISNGTGFYKYSISGNSWTTLTVVPGTFSSGGAMIRNGSDDSIYVLGGSGTGFYKYSISGNSWTTLTVVPGAVSSGGSMIRNGADDAIYVLRGGGTSFYKYSIFGNSWTTLTVVPAGGVSAAAVMIRNGADNDIYLLAGFSTFYKYSISGNSWTALTATPGSVGTRAAMIRNGADDDIYMISNGASGFYKYSISGNSWTGSGVSSLAPVPGAVSAGAAMIRNGADDFVYVLRGGSSFYKYSISGNSWTTLTVVPGAVSAGGAMIRNGSDDSIYVLGSSGFYKYSISGNSWTTLTVVPGAVSSGGAMIRNGSDDSIYVLRGGGATDFYKYSISGNSWTALTVVPGAVNAGAAMIRNGADDSIYVLRGGGGTGFYKYSISGNSWTTLTVAPGAIGNGATMIRNGSDDSIYVVRGNDATSFYKYSISGNSWTALTVVPGIVSSGGAMIRNGSDDSIYVLGASTRFYKYSISGNSWITLTAVPSLVSTGGNMIRNGSDQQIYILQGNQSTNLWRYTINNVTYPSSGTFTSAVIDTTGVASFGDVSWSATLPTSTSLTFATRSGITSTPDGTWSGWSDELFSSSIIASSPARYIQYRVTLGTSNTAITPTLSSVFLGYNTYQLSGNLVSSIFNSEETDNIMGAISWTEDTTLPASTTVTVSLRTASSADTIASASWTDFTNTTTNCAKLLGTVICTVDAIPTALKSGGDDQYFQYKITLTSPDGLTSPVVGSIILIYTQPDAPNIISTGGFAYLINQIVLPTPTSPTSTSPQIDPKITELNNLVANMEATGQKVPVVIKLVARGYKGLFTKVLAFGSQDEEVKTLQQFLNASGFTVAKTGPGSYGNETIFFGNLTVVALAKFQAANGITLAQGKLDFETRSFIENLSGTELLQPPNFRVLPPIFTRNLKLNMIGEDVRWLQIFLNSKGSVLSPSGLGSPGKETVFFGKLTEAALAEFQATNGLQPPYGSLDAVTRAFIKALRFKQL